MTNRTPSMTRRVKPPGVANLVSISTHVLVSGDEEKTRAFARDSCNDGVLRRHMPPQ